RTTSGWTATSGTSRPRPMLTAWRPADMLLQSHTHVNVVAPYAADGPVGYFMVDALRYELAHDLLDGLRRQFDGGDIQLRPAVGLVPSITPVGMANLCPGAD